MSNDNSAEKKGLLSEWWAALSKPTSRWSLGGLLAFGIVVGVVLWGGFNWALEITNTETSCMSFSGVFGVGSPDDLRFGLGGALLAASRTSFARCFFAR